MNRKQAMGLFTMVIIVGGTIYCVKKYRDSIKYGEEITLDEARDIIERGRQGVVYDSEDIVTDEQVAESIIRTGEEMGMSSEEIEELVDEARDEASWNSSFSVNNDNYDYYDGLDYNRPLSEYITEEEENMRFEPNSIQARDHFIKMELAELAPNTQEYQIMKRLFDFIFEPLNNGDEILYSQLSDHRREYFGDDSKWNDQVSMADIITHYARITDWNIGDGVGKWVVEFVHNTDFSELASAQVIGEIIDRMNEHRFMCARTGCYGLFGLDQYENGEARDIARGTVDGRLTYEIEFNEFLKRF